MVKGRQVDSNLSGTVEADGSLRLDVYIADLPGAPSRSQLKTRCTGLRVNGKAAKLSRLVSRGDHYELSLSAEPDTSLVGQVLPLDILYEDNAVIVVNKRQGMVTHPAQGNWSGTLANALLGRAIQAKRQVDQADQAGGAAVPARAGIVHRLDKDTSGVIIAAKTAVAQDYLASQFRDRSTVKFYLAIVLGRPSADSGRLDNQLARDPLDRKRFAPCAADKGKRAVSDWRRLASAGGCSLLLLRPRTGRTHQLRVHCRQLGCPILGDPIYGRPAKVLPEASLMLHARELRINLPGEDEPRRFLAPLPDHFLVALTRLGLTLPAELA
ncbi:MAG: hypothetical protein A2087_10635 [Spirochaetes bacterium GWD1_61_31]|nr:MAG: hypothetical protein A2Y37_00165 [Spirochaetes bacterium GWB1_60_80]OHD37127.1 MAG: hypothetical protein A2087_10635 [Spirochaetes bacterium GWD1_61_31]OHD42657.1 MAG: hypothetical protein A2Y35_12130 [Spirochaetes bacterium GWE1_60_18]OHD58538.1 MAG: hypothetical protein A2Y32_08710 [Spirochaetes bacterium GWF1_60_12]